MSTTPLSADELIERMSTQLRQLIDERRLEQPALIGIHSGGVWIAERLRAALGLEEPIGALDISFYRDDFTRAGINPQVRPSRLPITIDERDIILVDDVLYTGRTVRAALNEIFDYGRPNSVALAVMIDRGERELPIAANVVGQAIALAPGEQIKLEGPEPLELSVRRRA